MKRRLTFASIVFLTTVFFVGCATEQRTEAMSELVQPIELRRLSFLPPAGDGWEGGKDTSSPLEYAVFKKGGSNNEPVIGVMVWQYRTDDPVTSGDELWAYILQPYRDAVDADGQDTTLEFRAGTIPTNPGSRLAFVLPHASPHANLHFEFSPGYSKRRYRLEQSSGSHPLEWHSVPGTWVGPGTECWQLFCPPPRVSAQFYRLVIEMTGS